MNYYIMSLRIATGSTNDRFQWRWSDVREELYRLRRNAENLQEGPSIVIGILIFI